MKNYQFWIMIIVLGVIAFCNIKIMLWLPKIHQELWEVAIRLL